MQLKQSQSRYIRIQISFKYVVIASHQHFNHSILPCQYLLALRVSGCGLVQ